LLCATVTASTMAELRAARDRAVDADLVELRLDTVADPDVAGALQGRRRPVIITCRMREEGGAFRGSEEERRRLLGEALAQGAEYVDLEWRAGFEEVIAREGGRRIVLSFHDFASMPHDLHGIARAMRAVGAEVVKIAARARRLSDCVTLLELARSIDEPDHMILIAMGEAGLSSRVLAGRFGSRWTYAGGVKDVGQVSVPELLHEYRFREINDGTALYGVVGSPVSHSVSPAMHNAAFRMGGIDAVYLPMPAADADDFMTFARAMRVSGASVTIPFKVAMCERVDEVYPVARRIGAINTVRFEHGRSAGDNTDAAGFLQPLTDRGILLGGVRAAILGAGGSARAVAVALASTGAEVSVHARDRGRAEEVALLASARVGAWPIQPHTWDLLVNCTPIGMHPRLDDSPVPIEAITGKWVYDLVYNPAETKLLRDAETAGCRTIGGLEMLVAQAREQFQWWTGARPAAGVMRAAALARLSEFTTHEKHVV
jgi:3-dehydroquinate dehydratase/shikimate dehydrogenase